MFIEKSVTCAHPGGTHEVIYSVFNPQGTRTVICMHGLSRNGRDFDWLAEKLAADGYRVICPDMAGRGRSKRLNNPTHYNYPQYIADIATLCAQEKITAADWIGTSMGGLIGMMLATQPESFIKRLVINDIGPFVPAAALQRIKTYVGLSPPYHTWDSFYAAFKKRMAPFGLKTEAEWCFFAKISAQQLPDGSFMQNYDTAIIDGMGPIETIIDLDLWALWTLVKQPVLILHGANSDVLSTETLHKMMLGKQATSVSFADVGHAPALLDDQQINTIRDWLKCY